MLGLNNILASINDLHIGDHPLPYVNVWLFTFCFVWLVLHCHLVDILIEHTNSPQLRLIADSRTLSYSKRNVKQLKHIII